MDPQLVCLVVLIGAFLQFASALVPNRGIARHHDSYSSTALSFDLFGLGPAEVIVIGAAAGLLFGPDRIKSQLRESGVKNAFTGEGWKADQLDRINLMRETADKMRKRRSWRRINQAIADEDTDIIARLTTYENDDGDSVD